MMSITFSTTDNKLTINTPERFDFGSHKEFRSAIATINPNINHACIDMRMTGYVDSSALGMLLMLKSKMGNNKEAVSLINTRPEVKKILDIANFGQLFSLR